MRITSRSAVSRVAQLGSVPVRVRTAAAARNRKGPVKRSFRGVCPRVSNLMKLLNSVLHIVLFLVVCGCANPQIPDCINCKINGIRISRIDIDDGADLATSVVRAMPIGGLQSYDIIVEASSDGTFPIVEGFTATDISLKDVLKLLCDSCGYRYSLTSDGLYFSERSTGCIMPVHVDVISK